MTPPDPVGGRPVAGPPRALTVQLPCRVSPTARAIRHPVTFGVDWSVSTPHDPQLERIAAALGGGASCLPLIEGALPGLRLWWARSHRAVAAPIRPQERGGSWSTTDPAASCCPRTGFVQAADAAAHAREPRHIARVTAGDPRQLGTLVRAVASVCDPQPPDGENRELVEQAWQCGMPPEWVRGVCQEVHSELGDLAKPGLGFLLGLVGTGSDPAWAARTCAATGDTDGATLEWLAGTMTDLDRQVEGARAAWLATGSRRVDIVALSDAGYTCEQAVALAQGWGLSVPGAAKLLHGWIGNGYRPTVGQLNELRNFGHTYLPSAPASAAVARIVAGLGRRGDPDRATDYALALLRAGTVPATISEFRRGRLGH